MIPSIPWSLVINNTENILVKLDTETIGQDKKPENLARNISSKVKKTRRSVTLEPMNPYERRIIHSALQNDKYVETYSEGEDPYRKVVISYKRSNRDSRPYKYGKDNSRNYSRDYKKDYREYKESKKCCFKWKCINEPEDGCLKTLL